MIISILQHPDPHLTRPTSLVTDFQSAWLLALIDDLTGTLLAHANAAALAAPQIGCDAAVFVMREADGVLVVINPIVEQVTKHSVAIEGCMSFAMGKVAWPVRGPERAYVRYQDEGGEVHATELEGFKARCFAHEAEHLRGKTMLDRIPVWQRKMFLRKVVMSLGSGQ